MAIGHGKEKDGPTCVRAEVLRPYDLRIQFAPRIIGLPPEPASLNFRGRSCVKGHLQVPVKTDGRETKTLPLPNLRSNRENLMRERCYIKQRYTRSQQAPAASADPGQTVVDTSFLSCPLDRRTTNEGEPRMVRWVWDTSTRAIFILQHTYIRVLLYVSLSEVTCSVLRRCMSIGHGPQGAWAR
jgi:hypothetical protein